MRQFVYKTLVLLVLGINILTSSVKAQDGQTRRVNVPYLGTAPPAQSFTPAIFWFGKVDPNHNNADVRLYYYDSYLKIVVHIIDRRLYYDTTPSQVDLTEWDSVSLYLDLDGYNEPSPGSNAYRHDAQLNWWEPRDDYQISYKGNGTDWVPYPVSFEVTTGFRGDALNDDQDDKGWSIEFMIPFTSLGLSAAPPPGTLWGLGVVVHDRDDPSAAPVPDTLWPEQMNPAIPATWGQLHFGIPVYEQPPVIPAGITTIRHGLNGANVVDGHVGGHTTCGEDLDHWTEWGEANYAGYSQINIQNQWDISDYPCFSKFFITFPLDSLPNNQSITSATLSMYLFGGSGGGVYGDPPDSYIQVLTVAEDWDEATLNWNNAPQAVENISGTWVHPISSTEWVLYTWDVSRAVANAYAAGEPLRLALYSADGEYHTGKYFISSDISEYDEHTRPTLTIQWGDLCTSPGVECSTIHLPLILAH